MRFLGRTVIALAAALSLAGLLGGNAAVARDGPSAKEEVVFFPSVASAASIPDGKQWSLTIRGRVHTPAKHSVTRQKLIDALALRLHADKNDKLYRERAAYFVSDTILSAFPQRVDAVSFAI